MNAISKITQEANGKFAVKSFAKDLVAAASKQFPIEQITGQIGIEDVAHLSLEEIVSGKLQSLNVAFCILQSNAFEGLKSVDATRSALTLDFKAKPSNLKNGGLKIISSEGHEYFCGNLAAVRAALKPLENVLHGDVEYFALALQKALVSKALKLNKPVLFSDPMLEHEDKHTMYMVDRYLHANKVQPYPLASNDVARKL